MGSLESVAVAASGTVGTARQAEKLEATLIATAALAGVELVKLADGSWIASRWSMVKPLATTEAVQDWLQRVAGAQS